MPAKVTVFVGWSGPRSRAVAVAFAEWLPNVIQATTPWVSEKMDRGAQWFSTIGTKLKAADYGVLCVTPENVNEAWVHFEAGALAIHTNERLTCPYLLDMTSAQLAGPLGQLQAAVADRDGTLQVVETINGLLDEPVQLRGDRLRQAFDVWWQRMEQKLAEARAIPAAQPSVPQREIDDKIDEVLDIVRALQRSQSNHSDSEGLLDAPIPNFRANLGFTSQSGLQKAFLKAMGYPTGLIDEAALGKGVLVEPVPVPPPPAKPPVRTVRARIGKPKPKQ